MKNNEPEPPAIPVSAKRRPHRRWFALVTLMMSSLVAALILEGACRLLGFGPATQSDPRAIDPNNLHPMGFLREAQLKRWVHPPRLVTRVVTDEHPAGTIVIRRNDCGFREDEDTPIPKAEGVYRVMVLGDSHTDGVCFNDESYANRLERLLAQSHKEAALEVINAGHSTFSPYQEWWLYEQVGRHFSPNLVVVGFYAGNDYWDLMRQDDRVHLRSRDNTFEHADPTDSSAASNSAGAVHPSANAPSIASRIQMFLRNHTATYHALAGIGPLRRLFVRLQYAPQERPIQLLRQEASAAYWQSLGQAYYFAHHPGDLDQADATWSAVLQRLHDSTQRDGARLLILVIPSLREIDPQIDPAGIQSAMKILGLTEAQSQLDSDIADRAVRQAQRLGVDVIDLRQNFKASLSQNREHHLFYKFDHHLNPAGHSIVAEVMAHNLNSDVEKPHSK